MNLTLYAPTLNFREDEDRRIAHKTFSPVAEVGQGEDAAHKLHLRNTTHAGNSSSAMSEADHMILAVKRFYGSDQWRIT
jgi:hypothetical protein